MNRLARGAARLARPQRAGVRLGAATSVRSYTSILDFDDEMDTWPRSKANSIVNVCAQGERMIVERLGKMHDVRDGGWFIAIPVVDQIRYVVDMREKALAIAPQACISKDNVAVMVSGNLYCQFVDPVKAAYGSKNPIYAVKQHAQSSMRAAIGEMELDQILRARAELNATILESVQEAATAWGLVIKRYEVTEVTPDLRTSEAMGRQAAAERERRSKVLEAEGAKRAAELESEGDKIRMINTSEGELIKVQNYARAKKYQLQAEAEGEAVAVKAKAIAHAEAMQTISKALQGDSAADAAKIQVAHAYIDMYSDIGQKSNTMIFNDRPADVNALFAQASTVVGGGLAGTAGSKLLPDANKP